MGGRGAGAVGGLALQNRLHAPRHRPPALAHGTDHRASCPPLLQVFAHMVPDPVANPPVYNINMDPTGRFAFVEFTTEEMATKALEMDKVVGARGGGS